MAALKDILIYILEKYPYKNELSNARLTKLVYLADWYNTLHNEKPISSIKWYFDNYGPFVWDIYKEVEKNPIFNIKHTTNFFGKEKKLISLKKNQNYNLNQNEIKSIDKIIEITKELNWEKFINLVYSTYPILTTEKYNYLNLKNKAQEYKQQKAQQVRG
jgi:uncharacterized phage-associated protein